MNRGVLRDPLWVRAPVHLLRFPALFAAVVLAAVVLGLVAVSGPRYLAAAEQGALDLELDDRRPQDVGLTVEAYGRTSPGQVAEADALLRGEVASLDALRPGTLRLLPSPSVRRLSASPEGDDTALIEQRVQLYAQEGALERITPADGRPLDDPSRPEGVWLPGQVTKPDGDAYGPGDTVTFELLGAPQDVPVAGVYRDLADEATAGGYWQSVSLLYTPRDTPQGPEVPPPLVLGQPDVVLDLAQQVDAATSHVWQFPLEGDERLTPTAGGRLLEAFRRLEERLRSDGDPLGEAVSGLADRSFNLTVTSSLGAAVERAGETAGATRGPVRALALGGQVVALVLVGAAAAFRARRRRVEVRLLAADGVGPLNQALRATIEAAAPMAAGVFLGWVSAHLLVEVLGPAVPGTSPTQAAALPAAGAATLVGLSVYGVTTALDAAREPRVVAGAASPVGQFAARFPWEAISLALATAAWYSMQARAPGASRATSDAAGELDLLVLAFPILLIAGCSGLAARGLRHLLPMVRRWTDGWPTPAFLAARRLGDASRGAVLLVTVTALALGVVVYAGAVADSTLEGAIAKARLRTGGDVRVDLPPDATVPEDLPARTTVVTSARAEIVPGEFDVEVLTVDPATFASAAADEGSGGDPRLDELLAALGRDDGERLPALVVGGDEVDLPGRPVLQTSRWELPIRPVAAASVFPTARPGRPTIVVAAQPYLARIDAQEPRTDQRLLAEERILARAVAGARAVDVLADLRSAGVVLREVRTIDETLAQPALRAAGWTFAYLAALGALAGLLAIVGVVLYLQEQQAAREVAFALASRMGLTRRQHLLAVGLELIGMLVSAAVLGASLALVAARLALPRLDPLPGLQPPAVLAVPVTTLLALFAAVAMASLAGAWFVQRTAEQAKVAEVLRLAR